MDPFPLYSYNNEEDASKPTCIYKSSLESIKIALEKNTLDKKNFSPMREFLFMDMMHNRVRGMKTMTLWTYSSITRTMLRITTFECKKEDKRNLQHFLELFLTTLRQVKGDDEYQYLLHGFLVDVVGANFHGVKGVFRKAGVLRSTVCQWHFMRCACTNMLKHVPDEYEECNDCHALDDDKCLDYVLRCIFIASAIKCVIITSACVYIQYKCHLPLSGNWPSDNMIEGVLVVLLVSVLTTGYMPLLLTDKSMLPYMMMLCDYLHEVLHL